MHIRIVLKSLAFSCLRTCKMKMKSPWRALRIVKIHAKTMAFLLTMSRPKTQVRPSRGRRMKDAFTRLLKVNKMAIKLALRYIRISL